MVERYVRDVEAASSNLVTSTKKSSGDFSPDDFFVDVMIDSSSSPDACGGNVVRILSSGDFSPDDFFVDVTIDSSSSPDACVGNVVRILSCVFVNYCFSHLKFLLICGIIDKVILFPHGGRYERY